MLGDLTKIGRFLAVLTLSILLSSAIAAAPALEVLNGDLELSGNNLTDNNTVIWDANQSNVPAGSVDSAGLNWSNLGIAKSDVSASNVSLGNVQNINQSNMAGSSLSWDSNTQTINLSQQSATSGEVLEWDGSSWSPATDDTGSDNQTLTVTNESSGKHDKINISGGNTVMIDDAFEADTDTNASTECTGSNTYLAGDGSCVAESDTSSTNEHQDLGATNNSNGKNDLITITNGQNVTIQDDFEADTDTDTHADVNDSASNTVVSDPTSLLFTTSNDASVTISSSNQGAQIDYSVTDTNASTQCTGTNEFLDADGDCVSIGNGLSSGTTLTVDLDGSTLSKSGSGLKVSSIGNSEISSGAVEGDAGSNTDSISDGSINANDFASAVAGNSLSKSGSALNVDDNWVNESGDTMSGNLDMGGSNNITNAKMANLTKTSGSLPSCNNDRDGAIMYNGTHWGCNGSSWNKFY